MRSKWVIAAWAIGASGFLAGAGAVVHQSLHHPAPSASAARVKKPPVPHQVKKPTVAKSPAATQGQTVGGTPASSSPGPSSSAGLTAFKGQSVSLETPALTSSALPRNYPLANNPVEFYTPRDFTMIEALSAVLKGAPVAVQIFSEATSPVLALAVAYNGSPVATHVFSNPISVAAVSGESLYIESLPPDQAPQWYGFNLISGAMVEGATPPPGWSTTSPDIQGLPLDIARTTLMPNPDPTTAVASVTGSSLRDVLVGEVNAMLLTALVPSEVLVNQSTPTQAALTALVPTRWRTIDFQDVSGTWVPTRIHTTTDHLALTYDVSSQSVVMPYPEMQTVQRAMATDNYSALDTQTGALARLPINLEGAFVNGVRNTPKINLLDQGRSILALTYMVKDNGHTVYVPIGWYWWKNPPSFLSPVTPSAPPSASPPPNAPPSSSSTPAS